MKRLISFIVSCSGLYAQTDLHLLNIIPDPRNQIVGSVGFRALSGNAIVVKSPNVMASNYTLILPTPTGAAGCVQDTSGFGQLAILPCGGAGGVLTPPVVITGGTSSPILAVSQSGSGLAEQINGRALIGSQSVVSPCCSLQLFIQDSSAFDVPGIQFLSHTGITLGQINSGTTAAFDFTTNGIPHALTIQQDGTSHITFASGGPLLTVGNTGAGLSEQINGRLLIDSPSVVSPCCTLQMYIQDSSGFDVPGIQFLSRTGTTLAQLNSGTTAAIAVSTTGLNNVFTILQDGTTHIAFSSTGNLLTVTNSGSGFAISANSANIGALTVGSCSGCGGGGGVTSATAGSNMAVSSSTGAVTFSTVTSPNFTSLLIGGNTSINSSNAFVGAGITVNLGHASGGNAVCVNASTHVFYESTSASC